WNYDYAYISAIHNDFLVDRGNGVSTPATLAEVAQMPNAPANVYAAIQNVLANTVAPKAFWTSGQYNMQAGNYYVDIYSPGDGTLDDGTTPSGIGAGIHPNCTYALVRISFGANNIEPGGRVRYTPVGADDPVHSRIYVVDLSQTGWIRISSPTGPASFAYDGTPAGQLAVTIYALTPEDTNPATNLNIVAPPLITMDAVRFTQVNTAVVNPNLGPINPTGRILGPVVGTTKLAGTTVAQQDLIYFAREETFVDPNAVTPTDPTKPVDPITNPLIPDPTALTTAPVFYCVDNRDGVNAGMNVPSINRVKWRYVGIPTSTNNFLTPGGGTASASPLLANVRCRDGNVRTMVFFATTNNDNSFGRVYAFDALGNPATLQTRVYWVYPSYRPTTGAENATGNFTNVQFQYHDPNYYHDPSVPATWPAPYPAAGTWWAPDQQLGKNVGSEYYDGEVGANAAQQGSYVVKDNGTALPSFAGLQASPVLIDDPNGLTVNAAQVLLIPSTNGRIYAFDAGGRGDFNAADLTTTGTTQRLWTYPHFGADAYHSQNLQGLVSPPTNTYVDDSPLGAFRVTPTYDADYPGGIISGIRPLMLGSDDGHMYAINPIHDILNGINANQTANWNPRLNWVYPALDQQGLGSDISVAAIFPGRAPRQMYFTCGGRVYAIPESPPPGVNTLTWVFPFTPNPPAPNPNDPTTIPVEATFTRSGPVVVSSGLINDGTNNNYVYTLQNDGNIIALDAVGAAGTSTVLGQGQPTQAAFTRSAPILVRLDPQLNNLGYDPNKSVPMLVYADDGGAIWGVAATPTTLTDLNGNLIPGVMPTLWENDDTVYGTGRPAPPALINGTIIEGGEDGQLRAYGVGVGLNQDQETIGTGELLDQTIATVGNAYGLSIDIRALDLYKKADWDQMMLPRNNSAHKTPLLQDQNGNNIANGAQPAPNNINGATTPAFGVDWGDSLYIATAGVYHAVETSDQSQEFYGTGPPTIRVTFTIELPGRAPITPPPITVTPFVVQPSLVGGNAPPGQVWPDDTGVSDGEHGNLKIYANDPTAMMQPSYNQYSGRAQNVYAWVAKIRVPIQPDQLRTFLPGSAGYRVTAFAQIQQNIQQQGQAVGVPGLETSQTNTLAIGQHDFVQNARGGGGLNNPGTPPFATDPLLLPSKPKALIVTNPISLTVRNFSANDMTGTGNPNVIGWAPSINVPGNIAFPGEVLGNGNRALNPVGPNAGIAPIKALFAPISMTPPGSTGVYKGVDNAGNPQDALFVMDRSAISRMTGRALRVQIVNKPLRWAGGPTSVMNPLPWEQLPNNVTDTRDYPNISTDNLSITTVSGQDAIRSEISLAEPVFNNSDPDPLATRVPVPVQLNMSSKVPKFQPASVNRGLATATLPNGAQWTFGSSYLDIGGNNRGNKVVGQLVTPSPILGPMVVTNGQPVAPGNGLAFPAAGYISELVVRVVPPGAANAGNNRYNPQAIFDDSRNDGASSAAVQQAYRAFEIGTTVPPNIKLRVQETTLDTGKWPHGSGYSDINPATSFYRYPFSPTGSLDWQLSLNSGGGLFSPWDVDPLIDKAGNISGRGQMFRPFTLVSESNVNLIDLRIAKLVGMNGANISPASLGPNVDITQPGPNGTASAFRLISNEVNALSISPLFAVPYNGPGVGYIGITSSFDHISSNSNPGNLKYNEHALWPLPNPYVVQADIDAANALNASLPVVNSPAAGVMGWTGGVQPQPTLGKPRVGDGSGRIATVPDMPHDAPNLPAFYNDANGNPVAFGNFFKSPEIGVAIPIGTPVGTYSNPVQVYEDNTPLQWAEWLANSSGFGSGSSHDGILNVTSAGAPLEPRTDPTFTLKVSVGESRLTNLLTSPQFQLSTLAQADVFNQPGGSNLLPAVLMATGSDAAGLNRNLYMYWSTNRVGGGASNSPWTLAYSFMNAPYASAPIVQGDFNPVRPGLGPQAAWWSSPTLFQGWGKGGTGNPAPLDYLFPSTPQQQANDQVGSFLPPFLGPGQPVNNTLRLSSPAATGAVDFSGGYNSLNYNDREAYLFWQGQIDKPQFVGQGNAGVQQQRDTRSFWSQIGYKGAPLPTGEPVNPTWSLLNDPAFTKLSPKPLLVKLPARAGFAATKYLYLFWHAGNASQTALYYNVASTVFLAIPFDPSKGAVFGNDIKLPTPGSLVWESDPTPMYRHLIINNTDVDAIDVVYTGVLKNRKTVEILLSRYAINRADGSLSLIALPAVQQETMSRVGTTHTYAARDAAWMQGSGPNGTLTSADVSGQIQIDWQHNGVGQVYHLNTRPDGTKQLGQSDAAGGLVYYDMMARDDNGVPAVGADAYGGGQIVVDARSGTISFPQIPPGVADTILVSYQPFVMRLNASRDETNVQRSSLVPTGWVNDPAFAPHSAITSAGNNTNAVAIFDRAPNTRGNLTAPGVIFNNNNVLQPPGTLPELDRMWVLYRKSDPSGGVKSTIYYKAMRLMVKLPRPFALGAPNALGLQFLAANPVVAGANGPYEVDWIRGRIYFTELDEGSQITVNYTYFDPVSNSNKNSGNLRYTVAWGDEISTATQTGDQTTPEVVLPTDQVVNEGQVAAVKDPFLDKLWVFWSSTRNGTTDLFYETIAPQFYPAASNQH
ncbi:MAG TPA: hypothetical protein VKU00_19085, partial [Chthonomonadaceae bacterium]|nr:hypothetical protein [Chthonomonadaceae bacterium]